MKREKGKPAEAPAPAKAESSRTSAAVPATKGPSSPMLSSAAPIAEDGKRPLMSSELARQEEPVVVKPPAGPPMTSSFEWGDKSPLAFLSRNATAAELEGFVAAVEARQAAERGKPRLETLWVCPRCARQQRDGADRHGRKDIPCFFCNPRLYADGQVMSEVTDAAGVAAFLERERIEKERWQKSLALAKKLAAKRREEDALLERHGLR